MIAAFMQVAGLAGLTVAGWAGFGWPGGVAALSVSALYVGLAMED